MLPLRLKQLLNEARSYGQRFWCWWLAALKASIPAALCAYFKERSVHIYADLSEQEIHVTRSTNGNCRTLCRQPVDRHRSDLGITDLSLEALDHPPAAVVRLDPKLTYVRRITLPLAAEANLKLIISNEIDRQTPFTLDQTYFDFSVVQRDLRRQTMSVQLSLVKRPLVDNTIALLKRSGIDVHSVTIGRSASTEAAVNFLHFVALPRRATWSRVNLAIGACTVILGVLALEREYSRLQIRADEINAAIDTVRAKARESVEMEKRIGEHQARLTFLDKKKETSSALMALDDLTHALPDTTWITQFQITGRALRVSGFAPDASALVSNLSSAPTFRNPRFSSPVTRMNDKPLDRFDLVIDLNTALKP